MPRNILVLFLAAVCAISGAVATPFSVSAQPPSGEATGPQCGTRDFVLRRLHQNYREEPIALAVTHNGSLLEVLASESGASWTIVISSADGLLACIVSSGENWRPMPAAPGERS